MKIKFETKVKILQFVCIILILVGAILGIGSIVYTIVTKVYPIHIVVVSIVLIMSGVALIENAYRWLN